MSIEEEMKNRTVKKKEERKGREETSAYRSQKTNYGPDSIKLYHHIIFLPNNLFGLNSKEQVSLNTNECTQIEERRQQMRPGVDELIMRVEERPKARGE